MERTDAESIIRESMGAVKIKNIAELARRTGMVPKTLYVHIQRPEMFTVAELRSIQKETGMSKEKLAQIVSS